MMELRTLLIDNYDSYTYNLFQLIAEVNGGAAAGSRSGVTALIAKPSLACEEGAKPNTPGLHSLAAALSSCRAPHIRVQPCPRCCATMRSAGRSWSAASPPASGTTLSSLPGLARPRGRPTLVRNLLMAWSG